MPDPIYYPKIPPFQAGRRCCCPRCGKGRLYNGLLTVSDTCSVCGLDLSPHDTGDGASVFVIFLLGGLVVPLALKVRGRFWTADMGASDFVAAGDYRSGYCVFTAGEGNIDCLSF